MRNRSKFKRSKLYLLSAAVAATSMTVPVAAMQLEEVVVTAQKREQSANDVGIAINTFTGEQIRELGILSADDIAMYTPGLTVNETAATGGAAVHHPRCRLSGLFDRSVLNCRHLF